MLFFVINILALTKTANATTAITATAVDIAAGLVLPMRRESNIKKESPDSRVHRLRIYVIIVVPIRGMK